MKIKVINTTTNSLEVAKNISKLLIQSKLSPCVQIIPKIISIYKWNKKIENSNEYLLIIKTTEKNLKYCINIIEDNHNYDIPEIISIDAKLLSNKYKKWFVGFYNIFATIC